MAWLGWCLVAAAMVVWACGARGFVDEVREFLRDIEKSATIESPAMIIMGNRRPEAHRGCRSWSFCAEQARISPRRLPEPDSQQRKESLA